VALLLCDLDDTLVSRRAIFRAWAEALVADFDLPDREIAWFVDADDNGFRPREDLFRLIVDRFALSETVDQLAGRYRESYYSAFRCDAEVIASLGKARQSGFKIAIITNGPTWSQKIKIAAAGLTELVDACCISEEEGAWKPEEALFRAAAMRCGERLEGGWMVGDNPINDIGGATACGLRTVWMRIGRSWAPELDFTPTWQVDRFPEAVDLVLSGR